MTKYLKGVRDDLINAKGFILFRGFSVRKWGLQQSATAYMGMGAHFGHITSRNGRESCEGPRITARYASPLKCLKQSRYSHFSLNRLSTPIRPTSFDSFASTLPSKEANTMLIQAIKRPDIAELLVKHVWYFDRKGIISAGQEDFIRSLSRFSDKGPIPPLSAEQAEAIEYFDQLCLQESIRYVLKAGDVHFMTNNHLFYSRTEYEDHQAPTPRWHLPQL
ncbi:hypothetical protein N7451_000612 [Penicillium sp. IBT 35674x]|nr:hypothetical protein N7451_000612 [Penicillium sp. IBT 35674x]